MRGYRMIEVVGVLESMRQHERGPQLTVDVDRTIEHLRRHAQGIVAGVEELDLGTEDLRSALSLVAASGLYFIERHTGLFPGELAFATLAERQTHDLHPVALTRMQRDGATRAPYEIPGMSGDDQSGFLR